MIPIIKPTRALLLALLLAFAPIHAHAFNDAPAPAVSNINQDAEQPSGIQPEEIKQALMDWLEAVSLGNSSAIIQLYDPNAVLISTLSAKVYTTPAERKKYFDAFTAHKHLRGSIEQAYVRIYGDIAIASGLYTFIYKEHGKTVVIPARFTFVYKKTEDGLKIVEHHSSRQPK